MPESPIELRLRPYAALAAFSLACAGGRLVSDWPPHPEAAPGPRLAPRSLPEPAAWRTDYRGPGLSEGRIQEVVAGSAGPLFRVRYVDGETFLAGAEGWIARASGTGGPGAVSFERGLGAPLALLLATRGAYLLHASAIDIGGRAIALVGESGAGKSTLARAAAEAGFVRLADDQLPVRLGPEPAALPHFPQLKLPPAAWYPEAAPRELPIGAVVAFRHAPDQRTTLVRRLEGAAACLELVRATVAARLFGPEALARHLAAAAAAADRLAVLELRFPSGPEGLRHAIAALERLAATAT